MKRQETLPALSTTGTMIQSPVNPSTRRNREPNTKTATMLKLLDIEQLFEPIKSFGLRKPIFGTCAGAILLATSVSHPAQASFALMDISVERNGYGRQLDSRVTQIAPEAEFLRRAGGGNLEAVFIRAPIIRTVGGGVKVLASYRDTPVLVEQGRHMAATFHPELTVDPRVHGLFLAKL